MRMRSASFAALRNAASTECSSFGEGSLRKAIDEFVLHYHGDRNHASRSILERLYAQNPRKLVRLRGLADCYQALGDLHASRAEWKEAHAGYQQSVRLWERWMGVGTSSVYDRQRRELALSRVHRATGMITFP